MFDHTELKTRQRRYIEGLLSLEESHATPGAEGMFNQALTNGLLVLAWEASMDTDGKNGRTPSAVELLLAMEKREPAVISRDLVHLLIDVVGWSDHPRHGKIAEQRLLREHVDSLGALTAYRGLNNLTDYADSWKRLRLQDQERTERRRAKAFYLLCMRRMEPIWHELPHDIENLLGTHEKTGVLFCPVCEQRTYMASEEACALCSYVEVAAIEPRPRHGGTRYWTRRQPG